MLNISDGIEAAEAKGASDLAAANNLLPINWAVPFKPKQEARTSGMRIGMTRTPNMHKETLSYP